MSSVRLPSSMRVLGATLRAMSAQLLKAWSRLVRRAALDQCLPWHSFSLGGTAARAPESQTGTADILHRFTCPMRGTAQGPATQCHRRHSTIGCDLSGLAQSQQVQLLAGASASWWVAAYNTWAPGRGGNSMFDRRVCALHSFGFVLCVCVVWCWLVWAQADKDACQCGCLGFVWRHAAAHVL